MKHLLRLLRPGLGLGVVLLLVVPPAGARYYKHIDENGVIHFSDAPTNARFRPVGPASRGPSSTRNPYRALMQEVARKHGLDPNLVEAVARAESGYRNDAVSPKGAQGLMQLMPDTAARYRVEDPFDPQQNVEGAVKYLRHLLLAYGGDLLLALAAYNAGEEAVSLYGGVPPFPETQAYVQRVLAYYRAWEFEPSRPDRGGGRRVYKVRVSPQHVLYTNVPP